jgi:hypothetical protein
MAGRFLHRPPLRVSRSWEWEPKTTQVTYEGKDKDGKPGQGYLQALGTEQPIRHGEERG